jgi:hypothetical protein
MKVKDLIAKLQEFDPELTVVIPDSEYGDTTVSEVNIVKDTYVYWDKATTLQLSGNDLTKEDIDPKYFFPQERPAPRADGFMKGYQRLLQEVFTDQLNSRLHPSFYKGSPPAKDGVVTFTVIKGDKE